jgi:arylsulfatase A-like enzyme
MLDLLRDRGELANTYIVFAADNGCTWASTVT